MKITDAIAVGNQWVIEYQRRAELLAKHLDIHIRAMDVLESSSWPEAHKQSMMSTADALLINVVENLCAVTALCDCHTSPADTGPFPRPDDADIVRPQQGPWTLSTMTASSSADPGWRYVECTGTALVGGVNVFHDPFATDLVHANVALVLASPRMLEALEDIRDILCQCEGSAEGSRPENVTRAADGILDLLEDVLEAALPIRRPRKGGAA